MQISKSSDLLHNLKLNTLSIGDSGKGKTHFIGTMCDFGKPFIISSEKGLTTIADREFDFIEVDSFEEFGEACKWYMANWEKEGYTHLAIDSFTRLQQYLMFGLNKDGKLTQSQWGEVLATLRKTVNWLTKSCPTHVHMSAMAMESKDDLTGGIKIYPNVQGSFRYDLAGYFDVVMYHDCGPKDGKQDYWVQTQGDQRITARSRASSIKQLKKFETNNYSVIDGVLEAARQGA